MTIKDIKSVYFIGAGGIGMSAMARYFVSLGVVVAGYDKTPSALTRQLEKEGLLLHYEEDVEQIPHACRNRETTLVVFTPAIPETHRELVFFKENGFTTMKRAQVLGILTEASRGLCFAGTHGKTTTSAMCAHIMHQSHIDCNAFLGGISKNYATNHILSKQSEYVVIEADEFDRSFHWLRPWMTVITSTDSDHLDIYGTKEAYLDSFRHYTTLIRQGGALIIRRGLEMRHETAEGVRIFDYGLDEGDFHAANIRIDDGEITFDFISPTECVKNVSLGQPVPINIENGVAAMAMAQLCGCTAEELRYGMSTYKGVDRRFDFKLKTDKIVFLSDYAHHPKEIFHSAHSIRQLYRNRRITAIFQPHLYTRTRDFYKEFANALNQLDEVVLTEIYPAREMPIEGVTSKLIYDNLDDRVEKHLVCKDNVQEFVKEHDFEVLVVLGAGDLDNQVPEIEKILRQKYDIVGKNK
ncbi:UDP-N-acetylmuramate--L-alanine ligase [Prevotella sp. OH937_COT-195]|uniref:UDP-N-acetylmuramate--L-alanine ligase n=1 Tax=Prevotella sp. OH937_COT-195 TaxID=2491051 RepID=UPI000F64DD41|nr:Mur ligase family protein [Prevotella sp. OH937_COT-195]RRD00789.1 UDP-N-acetylmuramate--L-alanine ligase [Prevotella sp. OH937_COT-195]